MIVRLGLSSIQMRRLGQPADGVADLLPVVVAELAVADPGGVDPGLGAQQPLGELEVAHLQREEQHRAAGASSAAWAAMPRAKAVLPIAGRAPTTTSDARLQARQQLVEVVVAGGHAGDGVAPLVELLEAVEAVVEQVAGSAQRCR